MNDSCTCFGSIRIASMVRQYTWPIQLVKNTVQNVALSRSGPSTFEDREPGLLVIGDDDQALDERHKEAVTKSDGHEGVEHGCRSGKPSLRLQPSSRSQPTNAPVLDASG